MSTLILVTGATGKQGGAVTRALLARGHRVRALTRNPDAPAAAALALLGVELSTGSFEDAASLERAVAGVDAVFAMSTPFEAGTDVEVRQGKAIATAARDVSHLVYTSVGSADQKTGIPHFESKFAVEEHIRGLGVRHTILRPVYFMSNLFFPQTLEGLKKGVLAMPMPADRKLQQVAVEDIGAFGALVLEQPERFAGKAIDLAGDDLSGAEAAATLSKVTGRAISYAPVPLAAIRSFSEDMALMYEYFDRVGYSVDVAGLRRDYPEVGWHTFAAWAAKQDWRVLE